MQFVVSGGAGFIGSNLVHELQRRYPDAWISVIDDFSSGDFRNLIGFRGDVIARPCESFDWSASIRPGDVGTVYHLASITDTTVSDQRQMIERNVEGMRRAIDFARQRAGRLVYASSAATYGLAGGRMSESQAPAPANVYGFSKCILDNLAREHTDASLPIAGVRYFNVYGPREAHKDRMASMIYQLYRQMKSGSRPRIFIDGEQRRDFVYVKDAVAGTLQAAEAASAGVFNIGCGSCSSFNEIVAALNSGLGLALEPEYIENPYAAAYQSHTEADLSLAGASIGYRPAWSTAEGIKDYLQWLEAANA